MSIEKIKQCKLCGKDYPACSYCERQNEFLAWRSVGCCHEHFIGYVTLVNYINKEITKDEAKQELLNLEDKYGKIAYSPLNQNIVDEIFNDVVEDNVAEPKKSSRKKTTNK